MNIVVPNRSLAATWERNRLGAESLERYLEIETGLGMAATTVVQARYVLRRYLRRLGDPTRWTEDARVDHRGAALKAGKSRRTLINEDVFVDAFLSYLNDGREKWNSLFAGCGGPCLPPPLPADRRLVNPRKGMRARRVRPISAAETAILIEYADSLTSVGRNCDRLLAWRNTTALKLADAYALRNDEVCGLRVDSFGPNPDVPRYGDFGRVEILNGKGKARCGKRERIVFTVPARESIVLILQQYLTLIRPQFTRESSGALFTTTTGNPLAPHTLWTAFAKLRNGAGIAKDVDIH